tara:strand:- start:988 stop:5148 length:4161 start_codon:yes stop_codon:yes gene_type:complete
MSGAYGSSHWLYDADVFQTGQSLKFNDDDSSYLTRTPTTAGNRKTWTWAAWVKRCNIGSNQYLFQARIDDSSTEGNKVTFYFLSDNTIRVLNQTTVWKQTSQVFRDTSAWFHLLLSVDTTNSTTNDRVKIFVNGEQASYSTNAGPSLNADLAVNSTNQHYIGQEHGGYSFLDAYLFDVHLIDGQALDPTSFTKTENNQLQPKEYLGSYGTNGFRLNFLDDVISEGFNTVTYEGTGSATPNFISGIGFAPNFVWIKNRDASADHALYDSLRTNMLSSNQAAAEVAASGVVELNSDGFGIGSADARVNSAASFVAWCWDAGSTDGKTYTVKVVADGGNKYRFDDYGTSAVTLDLAEGGSYVFDQSDSSNDGHPMKFSTTSNGSHGGGSTYSTGVTYELDGVTKSESDYVSEFNSATTRQLKITVATSAPTLYYWCHYHSGMGGAINTNATKGSSNFDGTIQSVVKANTAKGFSIVTFEGTSTAGSVGHGLESAPKWIIAKNRDSATEWPVYHDSVNSGGGSYLRLNDNYANTSSSIIWTASPSSTVVNVGAYEYVNRDSMLFYCWSEVSGYSKFGSYTGSGSAGKQVTGLGFKPAWVMLKRTDSTGTWVIFDNTRNPQNTADKGINADLSDREYTSADGVVGIDFDSDGFTLQDNHTTRNASGGTYTFMAFGDTREAAFFRDVSGNNNNFTPNNLDYRDSMIDTPLTNFNILNRNHSRLDGGSNLVTSEGNLKMSAGASYGGDNRIAGSYLLSSGKWYWEMARTDSTGLGNQTATGVSNGSDELSSGQYSGNPTSSGASSVEWVLTDRGVACNGSTYTNLSSTIGTVTQGKIVQVALDMDNKKIWFGIDNTYSGNPSAGSGEAFSNLSDSVFTLQYSGESTQVFNFGQDSSFSGAKIPQGNGADGEDFFYAPPTGFKSLQLSNLPAPAIADPTTQFHTVLYTGDGNSTQNVDIATMNPDFVWIKSRSSGSGHHSLGNRVTGDRFLNSNQTIAEYSYSSFNFNSDNTIDVPSSANDYSMNTSSATYVAWNWVAGGATPSQTYTVKVVSDSGNKFRFDDFGTSAITLELQEGGTYTFDQSDSSNSGHPFRFSTTANGTHGGGSEYTVGVTTNGTAGSAGAYTRITVASGAPTLYYYCAVHSGMGGQANTNTLFGSTNVKGTIQSVASANTTSGFSIVTYTGNNTAGATVGHSLSSPPEMIWIKGRVATGADGNWNVYAKTQGDVINETDYLLLNSNTSVTDEAGAFNDTAATSSVFSLGTFADSNGSGKTFVAYCFHSVEGFSKIGTYYVASASTDGEFICTGFRVAWVMIKNTASGEDWEIWDAGRDPVNVTTKRLKANTNGADVTSTFIDFVSNGFKLRNTSGGYNASNKTFLYIAFAESPFKTASAR